MIEVKTDSADDQTVQTVDEAVNNAVSDVSDDTSLDAKKQTYDKAVAALKTAQEDYYSAKKSATLSKIKTAIKTWLAKWTPRILRGIEYVMAILVFYRIVIFPLL